MTDPAGGQPLERAGGRRRIDRVLASDFLDRLGDRSIDELRAMRKDAEQEEADLSYLRRMLQGRLDIVRAELSRRAGGEERDRDIVAYLSGVLADPSRSDRGLGRFLSVEPTRVDEHRRAMEHLVADVGISDVESQTHEDLRAAAGRLQEVERTVSDTRRRVQAVMDSCTAELGRRYRDGAASVDDLLTGG